MIYAALDIGSTNIKCALVDTGRLTVEEVDTAPFPGAKAPQTLRYEVDAESLYQLCVGMIDRAVEQNPELCGILFSTQMHGFVLSDDKGNPVWDYISWRDGACLEKTPQGEPWLSRLSDQLSSVDTAATGVPLRPKLAISNLYARICQGAPLPKGTLFHTLGGFISMRMGGGHTCHLTNAGPTGMCDVVNGRWMAELIQCAGAEEIQFPRIIRGIEPVGEYRKNGRSYPLFPDIGDHQVCILGSLAKLETQVNVNIGTAGMIGRIVPQFELGYENRPLLEGRFIRTLTGLPGGRHLQGLVDYLQDAAKLSGTSESENQIWQRLTAEAGKPGPEDLHFTLDTAADCFRTEGRLRAYSAMETAQALYETIGKTYAQGINALGTGVERLVYSGGAAVRNAALREQIERASGLPGSPNPRDAVMLGMLQLGLLAGGECHNLDQAYNRVSSE